MKKILFFILSLLLITLSVDARIRWVTPRGADVNTGADSSSTGAWLTWQHGFMNAEAGDTVYIRGGVYYPTEYYSYYNTVIYLNGGYVGAEVVGHTGTAANPICIWAYPPDYAAGNFPILDCRLIDPGEPGVDEQRYTTAIDMSLINYIHLKGLTIRNMYQRYSNVMCQGIYCAGNSNMIFENLTVHNIGGRAITSFQTLAYTTSQDETITTDSTYFLNCDVYNMCDSLDPDPSYQYEEPRTSYVAGLGDGFKIQCTAGAYMLVYGCRSWHFSDDGIDFNGEGLLSVVNCWISRGGDFTFTNEDGTYGGEEGNGIKYGALGYDVNTVTRILNNNLVVYNGGIGFDENNSRVEFYNINGEIYNNTTYRNSIGFGNFSQNPDDLPYANKYFNNIGYQDIRYARGDEAGDIVEGYNSWDENSYTWPNAERIPLTDDDFISVDTAQLYLPRQSDGSLPEITFLKLASTSDAIDAGTDVGLAFNGAAPDIGADETNYSYTPPDSPMNIGGKWGVSSRGVFLKKQE